MVSPQSSHPAFILSGPDPYFLLRERTCRIRTALCLSDMRPRHPLIDAFPPVQFWFPDIEPSISLLPEVPEAPMILSGTNVCLFILPIPPLFTPSAQDVCFYDHTNFFFRSSSGVPVTRRSPSKRPDTGGEGV